MTEAVLPSERALLSRRQVLTGLLMASAAAVAAIRKPNIRLNYLGNHNLEDVVPKRIGRWDFVTNSGLVIPPNDQLQLALYSQLLTRVYSDGNNSIELLIAYSAAETGFLQVHRPEFCYTAAGYQLSDFVLHKVQLPGAQLAYGQYADCDERFVDRETALLGAHRGSYSSQLGAAKADLCRGQSSPADAGRGTDPHIHCWAARCSGTRNNRRIRPGNDCVGVGTAAARLCRLIRSAARI